MRPKIILTAGFLTLVSAAAFADMIEVKDKGVLNGKIISDNGAEVEFKDASGNSHRFLKTDILYSDIDTASLDETSVSGKMHAGWAHFLEELKNLPDKYKKLTKKLTDKYIKMMSKPLDRSKTDSKMNTLSSSMDSASKAAVALSKKNMAAAREMRKQQEGQVENIKSRRSRFDSLED